MTVMHLTSVPYLVLVMSVNRHRFNSLMLLLLLMLILMLILILTLILILMLILMLMHNLLMIDPVSAAVILDLMETRGNSMKETADTINTTSGSRRVSSDLRADNSQNKRAPWKIARVIVGIVRIGRRTWHVARTTIEQTRRAVAMSRASKTTVRPRENNNSDKRADKQNIEQHPDPAQCAPARIRALLDAAQKGGDKGVQNRCSENALDSSIGAVDPAARLDRVDEAVHLVEA